MAANFAALPLPDLVRAALIEAEKNLAAGNYAEAEPLLWDVLRADPRSHRALHLLSGLGVQVGDFASAEVLADKAIALYAREADYHITMGRIRRGQQRHGEAEACLRTALSLTHARATRANAEVLLGLTLKAQGRIDEAIACYRKALHLQPGFPAAALNLANILRESGQAAQATTLYHEVAAANPGLPAAQGALAASLLTEGRHAEALEQYRRALELLPDQPGMQFVAGWLNGEQGDLAASIAAYRRAVEQDPGYADAWVNLGLALAESGQAQASLDSFLNAIRAQPGHVEAHVNLAAGLAGFGLTDQGLAVLERARELRPDDPSVLSNLGAVLIQGSKPEEAIGHLRRALSLAPESAQALVNLGMALRGPGVQGESIDLLRRGLALAPDDAYSHSNLLLSLCYTGGVGPGEIVEAARAFGARPFALTSRVGMTDAGTRIEPDPARRLRIGYVSPDFRTHSVAYFAEPVLEHHDRSAFEVFCYSVSALEDATTLRLKSRADHWRSCYSMPDAALAQLVREDRIDILVDLAGHTAQHRLTAFAHKPAPVQVTWLGYPSTLGLPAIDYRISDPRVDPPGYEQFNAESLLRLPGSYFCYRPGPAPTVGPLPAAAHKPITFGSFNALPKISDETVALWARVLREQPDSRLVIKTRLLAEAPARERVSSAFAASGVDMGRVELIPWEDTTASHLESYNRIDIALDTFPFNGATTTCEALWMGVPVVSLCGETHASRMGCSILAAAGLPELVAESADAFAAIAAGLAGDRPRLAGLRAGLRDRLRASPLFAEKDFTRGLESAYRAAWAQWCSTQS
ncbi:MAG: tetratricopeptide repeat protein [Betaproteobacteria bacterium]